MSSRAPSARHVLFMMESGQLYNLVSHTKGIAIKAHTEDGAKQLDELAQAAQALIEQFLRLADPSEITVTYDKFDDFTLIRLDLGEFTDDRGIFVRLMHTSHSGKVRPARLDSQVVLTIYRCGQRWEFLNEHQIRMVCGDDRIEHSADHYQSDMKDGVCNEYLNTSLSRVILKNCLAKNQNIEVKIGHSEPIPFMARAKDKMKIFLDYLDKYPSRGDR